MVFNSTESVYPVLWELSGRVEPADPSFCLVQVFTSECSLE